MSEIMLVNELKVYESMKEELLKNYENKVVAIKDGKLIGIYNSELEAFEDVIRKYGYVPVLIKRITREERMEELPSYTYGLLSVTY
ncbi:MAG: hypothetical protein QXR06_00995 [Candidatus Bathyarchaeia archaeon]|nr:hypothetical protein [Candidatus Bathyarchaeota archaeon]